MSRCSVCASSAALSGVNRRPFSSIAHFFGQRADAGGHHRHARGVGFRDDARRVLIPQRGHDKDIGVGQESRDIVMGHRAQELDGEPLCASTKAAGIGWVGVRIPCDA